MRLTWRFAAVELLLAVALCASSHALSCADALRQVLLQTYQLDSQWYKIDIASSQLTTDEVDPSELSIRAISQKEPLGVFSVHATITRDGLQLDAGQVSLRIHKFADVLVAADHLKRHDQPSDTKLTLQRMEITSLLEQPVTSFESLPELRMKRNLTKGQILTTSALEPVPDIDVGREVSIVCANGMFKVTADGIAQQAGSAGDYVKVRSRASGKTLTARVIDDHTVAVEP